MLSLLWCRTTVGFLHFPYTFTDCKIFFKLDQVLTITTVLRGLTCCKLLLVASRVSRYHETRPARRQAAAARGLCLVARVGN